MNLKRLLLKIKTSTRYWLIIVLVGSTSVDAAETLDLKNFRATYVAEYSGLPIKATGIRELTRNSDGSYQIRSAADAMLVKVDETSRFELHEGIIRPVSYHYKRNGLGKNKTRTGLFDWQQMTHTAKDDISALTPGTLDKLSYQVQLRLDVASAVTNKSNLQQFDYMIADKARRRSYQFKIVGEEILDTPLGELATIRLERLQDPDDATRTTHLWLARDHDFVMVRLRQHEQGQGFELNIDSLHWLDSVTNAAD